MFFRLFTLIVGFGIAVGSSNADCELPLPRFRFFAPLIFSPDGTLLPTDNDDEHSLSITIPAESNVILSCAPNYFKKSELNASKTLSAMCKSEQIFDVNGLEMFWMQDLGCEVRGVEEILKPIRGCSGASKTSVEFGYENPVKAKTIVLGEACYSEAEGRTIFVHTKYVESDKNHSIVLKTENINYLAQRHPESRYKIDFLVAARIDELNKRLEKLSLEKSPFLEPRHFLNTQNLYNGQLYSILKLGWNFAVANGFDRLPNYDLLLTDIMNVQERNFDLYLGTHSTLSLKTSNSGNVDIHLIPDEKKYPVPKFLWAVVVTESPKKAAAFLISNNIDSSEDDLMEMNICESKCIQMPWLVHLLKKDAYRQLKNGYVLCCEIDDFMRMVSEMPPLSGRYTLLI